MKPAKKSHQSDGSSACPIKGDDGNGFTLWHRPSKYFRWREVATARTEAELTRHLRTLPSGDVIALPTGQHPNESKARS